MASLRKSQCTQYCLYQAVVTKTATHVNGTRHHVISFEPWSGGPSVSISWNVPRKCITLCPAGAGSSSTSTSAAPAVGASPASGTRRKPEGTRATAAAQGEEEEEEEEQQHVQEEGGEGEGGSGVGVLSPLPSSMEVYPAGTVVVVRSVETDPGRTLKFARGETYEAAFQEIVGREVSRDSRRSSICFFHTRIPVGGQQDVGLGVLVFPEQVMYVCTPFNVFVHRPGSHRRKINEHTEHIFSPPSLCSTYLGFVARME